MFLLVAGVIVVGVASGEPAIALGALPPIFFGMGSSLWSQFSKNYGTTVADSPDGLRLRRGLLETRAQTVPPGRVQGVVVEEPLIWRRIGWVKAAATVAGYGAGGTGSTSTTLLPVAPREVATDVVRRVLPGIDWTQVALRGVPGRARWAAPIEAARLAAGVGDEGAERVLVTRRGRFGQRTDIVPLARLQSVRLRQGPWQRRLSLATVYADLSPGPVKAAALHRDEHDARALLDQLVAEARIARTTARPDRWMAAPQLPSRP